jgi:hypothetical protein
MRAAGGGARPAAARVAAAQGGGSPAQSQIELGCSNCLAVFTKTKHATRQNYLGPKHGLTGEEGGARLEEAVGGGGSPARASRRCGDRRREPRALAAFLSSLRSCHTYFSKENQLHNYMHARIMFHAYSDI